MYRDDFEVEALLPAFIASIVGYVVFGSVRGFGPLFGYADDFRLVSAPQLLWFAVIGVASGLVGLLYAKGFYGIAGLFGRLSGPRFVRPALGGLVVGCMALAVPEVLGTGYGWVQQGLGRSLLHIPLWIVLALPFARIVATGLSIGSGGSGGIFGPGMVIGAFVGAAVWRLVEPVVPSLGSDPAPYVVVGMMACFGSIARAPLAIMLMVAEMTGSLSLVVPAMVAVGLATLVVLPSDDTIYRSQLRSRAEAPAHRVLAGLPLLASVRATEAMLVPRCVIGADTRVSTAQARLEAAGVQSAPVVDDERRYVGTVSLSALEQMTGQDNANVREIIDASVAPVRDSAPLDEVVEAMGSSRWGTVVDGDRRVVGTIAMSDVVRAYRRALQASLRRIPDLAEDSGLAELTVDPRSPLVGATFRSARLPSGTLVTAVERGRDVFQPNGDTVICAQDRLTVLGGTADVGRLRTLAAAEHQVDDGG
jgi:CIC family chloride channel protein